MIGFAPGAVSEKTLSRQPNKKRGFERTNGRSSARFLFIMLPLAIVLLPKSAMAHR